MIRRATSEDTERLIEMGQRFAAESEYQGLIPVDQGQMSKTITGVLNNPEGLVLLSGSDASITGMIAMIAGVHPFSGERCAFELVWWVEPEARGDGVRLLRAAEEWAREQGIPKMQMVAPNPRVGKLYERMGYRPVEMSYWRVL